MVEIEMKGHSITLAGHSMLCPDIVQIIYNTLFQGLSEMIILVVHSAVIKHNNSMEDMA